MADAPERLEPLTSEERRCISLLRICEDEPEGVATTSALRKLLKLEEAVRTILPEAMRALDEALGDSDVDWHEDMRQEEPVQWAHVQLSRLLAYVEHAGGRMTLDLDKLAALWALRSLLLAAETQEDDGSA